MKSVLNLFFIPFIFACTSTVAVDSAQVDSEPIETEPPAPYQLQPEDNFHIDFVQYLKETDEVALPLKWKKDANVKLWYDSIGYSLEKVIYTNDEDYTRTEIPKALIPQFFDVKELTKVNFYDELNNFCGKGEFQRYEFLNQNIDPIPVAIYKVNKTKNVLYAVAGLETVLPAIPTKEAPEARLKQLIEYKLPKGYKESQSLRNGFLEKQFYAIQGYEEDGFITFAELYLEENGKLTKVHEDIDNWIYFHIHPIPIYHQEQPLLLCNMGKSETDWFQSSVLIFKNGKYVDISKR